MWLLTTVSIFFLHCSPTPTFCEIENSTFLYFAYGSNLLEKRLRIHNPSAIYIGLAVLKNHQLGFSMRVNYWSGAVSTILPDESRDVWGVLWRLNVSDMASLDRQEGVDKGWYYPKYVTVTSENETEYVARTYIETNSSLNHDEKVPSSTYLGVIIFGAVESKLPAEYIAYLLTFNSNGELADESIRKELGYPFF